MAEIKRKWDLLSQDRRQVVLREISSYFKTEHDADFGVIAAGEILDFFLREIGPEIYNKAVDASKMVVRQNAENVEIDVDLLRL